jgi:hypothetical protein
MTTENCLHWLDGYLEDRNTLNKNELERVKDMISNSIAIKAPRVKPTEHEVAKMVKELFPDLSDIEIQKLIVFFLDK